MRGLNVVMMMLLRRQGVHNGRQYIKVRRFWQGTSKLENA
jgi:hypothetical protein